MPQDVIIGLTVLAYRYEGLRRIDFEQDVIALLRSDFEKEVGPFPLRKSSLLYESWVQQAGGKIKGSRMAATAAEGTPSTQELSMEDERVVVPLWLLKQSNDEQMTKLYELLRKLPACIHWLLEQVVFPSFMQHQLLKLSASGQELGGSMLFGRRIGFSGAHACQPPPPVRCCSLTLAMYSSPSCHRYAVGPASTRPRT